MGVVKLGEAIDFVGAGALKIFRDCFTERDGVSWCWVRFSAAGVQGTLTWAFVHDPLRIQHLQDYGLAMAAIMAAVGFKNASERDK